MSSFHPAGRDPLEAGFAVEEDPLGPWRVVVELVPVDQAERSFDGIRTDEQPILLGTTTKFLFFYHPSTKTTEIVPIDATTALRVDSRRRREREQDSLVFPDSLANPDSVE